MPDMVPADELRRVRHYVKRIARILVPEWTVQVADHFDDSEHAEEASAAALIYPEARVRHAVIKLGPAWSDITTRTETAYTLTHEVCHLITAEISTLLFGATQKLDDAGAVLWEAVDIAEETAVHKLAVQLRPLLPKYGD